MEGFSIEDAPEFELWVEGERTRWRALFGELCERLSRLEAEEGLIAEAIATARLWARHAPLEEAAHRRLMELLSSAGESERALLAYEGFKNTLGRELGMEPSSPMQELAARLHEEVRERASLGASLARFSEALLLLICFRPWRCRWSAARRSLGRSSPSTRPPAWDKRASWPSLGRQG